MNIYESPRRSSGGLGVTDAKTLHAIQKSIEEGSSGDLDKQIREIGRELQTQVRAVEEVVKKKQIPLVIQEEVDEVKRAEKEKNWEESEKNKLCNEPSSLVRAVRRLWQEKIQLKIAQERTRIEKLKKENKRIEIKKLREYLREQISEYRTFGFDDTDRVIKDLNEELKSLAVE